MYNENTILRGKKVTVIPLQQSNLNSYLLVYKKASPFAEMYEKNDDLWNSARKDVENEYIQVGNRRFLIIENSLSKSVGYINFTFCDSRQIEVDVAIVEEYRRKGYAFEAAKLLIQNTIKNGLAESVIWSAFPSNRASCRIAEKLGGVPIEGRNLIKEAMQAAGCTFESIDEGDIPKTVSYEIRK